MEQALHDHINVRIRNFLRNYDHLVTGEVLIERDNAVVSFESLLGAVKQSGHLLYLLIDEYDNFANEVLMAGGNVGRQRYQELVEGEGIFKTIFKAFKTATSGQGLDRIFIVGVSPVVLSVREQRLQCCREYLSMDLILMISAALRRRKWPMLSGRCRSSGLYQKKRLPKF
ncbi:MAG: AAA family ATPase [Caldilineaceae bacterium]